MRADPSMNNQTGEVVSPHISTMKGDATKIEPLSVSCDNNAAVNGGKLHSESREMGHSPPGNTKADVVAGGASSTPRMPRMHPNDPQNVVPRRLPQARQTDTIFRESHTAPTTSWSNVVSANTPPNPIKMTARSTSSGETVLTSNMSQPLLGASAATGARSHSFDDTESPPPRHAVNRSMSFGNPADSNQQTSSVGMPPSHPGHSSYKISTLPTSVGHSPLMYPSTPYREFKPRSSMGSYSPISMGDSMTEKTSPMSSPSVSPYVSPAMNPRKQHGDGPPMWHLSDANEYHAEPSGPHQRLHSHLPQSIPEHHRHEPTNSAQHHHGGYHHSYMAPPHRPGPSSPPRHHLHPQSAGGQHHHHQSMYPRGPSGPKPAPHRSSMEVLKTLLRKKACLYEPETSFAVSLVTWLVGRRLTLAQGYFTRQQLQAGVHSCVAGKIKQGHVTRTKVNRCMQVILNSCFHYIIPRPDGSEECGEAFRVLFTREAADEEHLLGALPPPWNDLSLQSTTEEESHSSLFHESDDEHPAGKQHPPGKESSASPAGDSLVSGEKRPRGDSIDSKRPRGDSIDSSGGKRSVLLCFNENIRSAADVFRCHNEFIRDVAHTGNLSLSPEDWQAFFTGAKAYRKRSAIVESFQSRYFHLADMHDRMDKQGLAKLRTSWCAKRYEHDHAFCAFAHVDINRGWLRRDPYVYSYKPTMCPYIKPLKNAEDCYVNMCPLGVKCNHSHSKEEILYHPESYKRQPCRSAPGSCPLQDVCPNTHADMSAAHHGYNRQGKRHYHDNALHRSTYPGSKRRVAASTGHTCSGFGALPDVSPMLYIDPAPLSDFEKTLLLPGLQAIFRDHSSSIFYSTMNEGSPYQYGLFGYRKTQQEDTSTTSSNKPIGS